MGETAGTAATVPGAERQDSGLICRKCLKPVRVDEQLAATFAGGIGPVPRAVHAATGLEAGDDGHTAAPIDPALQGNAAPLKPPKPTPGSLGIDPAALQWQGAGGDGTLEVAIPDDPRWQRGDWVLVRKTGDPAERILVYDRNEWECFLDGARKGEFDDAAT